MRIRLQDIVKCKPSNFPNYVCTYFPFSFSEPDLFHKHSEKANLSGTQIGKDFTILHNLLYQYNFTNFTFVGPDPANVQSGSEIDLFRR